MIFSGCSIGVPLQQTKRNKPISHLLELKDFKVAKTVNHIPFVYVTNMETAGICRIRLKGLQDWVNEYYKQK